VLLDPGQIAHHEAGHWVIGDVLGFLTGAVSILPIPPRKAGGHTEVQAQCGALHSVERVEDFVCMLYAGTVAQHLHALTVAGTAEHERPGENGEDVTILVGGGDSDFALANEALERAGLATDAARERLLERTIKLVVVHLRRIEMLARALLVNGKITNPRKLLGWPEQRQAAPRATFTTEQEQAGARIYRDLRAVFPTAAVLGGRQRAAR
jgi:hypothetical protein